MINLAALFYRFMSGDNGPYDAESEELFMFLDRAGFIVKNLYAADPDGVKMAERFIYNDEAREMVRKYLDEYYDHAYQGASQPEPHPILSGLPKITNVIREAVQLMIRLETGT